MPRVSKKIETPPKPRSKKRTSQTAAAAAPVKYSADALSFLVELSLNNDRDWFKANQARYERLIREPTLALVLAMQPRLKHLSSHLVASAQKVGGSMMRPQRDTRFSADKEPYKTNVGVQFRHSAGKNVHAPGLYFHFDSDSVFVAAGIWHPDGEALRKVRTLIAAKPALYLKSCSSPEFSQLFRLGGESLKRAPRGFDPEHPMIEELKRKDFIAVSDLNPRLLTSARLEQELERRFAVANGFMKVLCRGLGLKY